MPAQLITSQLSIARELWRYGEPELADRALRLSADEVLAIGRRVFEMHFSGEDDRLWPGGPKDRAFLLASIEAVDGSPRRTRRVRRLAERALPPHLQASLADRLAAAEMIANRYHEQLTSRR
jgi:hypothetical protein